MEPGAADGRDRRDRSPTSSSRLDRAPAVLVLDGGHPIGVADPPGRARLPRRTRSPDERHERERATASRPARSTPARTADPVTGAVVTPISLATTFAQAAVGEHAGLRVRAHRQPDPPRARGVHRVARGRARTGLAFASGHGRRGRRAARCSRPGDHVVILPTTRTAARYRLVVAGARPDRRRVDRGRPHRPGALAGRVARRDARRLGRDADEPDAHGRRHRRGRRSRARARRARSSSTTRSRRRTSSSRSRSAPTSSCTRARSTSAVTPTSSAASSRIERRRARRRARGSSRTRSARCRRRSTATSCCAGSRRSRCAWTATARTRARSSRCSASTPRVERCSTRACPRTPATTSRAGRCATSAAWSSFVAAGGEAAALAVVGRDPRCSRWPSRSARSSR